MRNSDAHATEPCSNVVLPNHKNPSASLILAAGSEVPHDGPTFKKLLVN